MKLKLLVLLFLGFNSQIMQSQDCEIQEINYLSTFVNSRMWEIIGGNSFWDKETIRQLGAISNQEQKEDSYFYIPLLIQQVKNSYLDLEFNKEEELILIEISNLFEEILDKKGLRISANPEAGEICKKVNKMIEEYHKLCEDDNSFYKLIFTFDNGPFYGIDTKVNYETLDSIKLEKINLVLLLRGNRNGVNTLELLSESGDLKWRKVITRSKEEKITKVEFMEEPILVENKLGYKIGLIGDGELIQLYLKKDGEFRLFFHSW